MSDIVDADRLKDGREVVAKEADTVPLCKNPYSRGDEETLAIVFSRNYISPASAGLQLALKLYGAYHFFHFKFDERRSSITSGMHASNNLICSLSLALETSQRGDSGTRRVPISCVVETAG